MDFSEPQIERYSRQIILPWIGAKGQMQLQKSSVLCIGAGGLGSPALYYLAAAGIGTIGIADGDTVGLSNLQRQVLHFTEDLGKAKTHSAQDKLHRLNPEINICLYGRLDANNILSTLKSFDFIIEGTDSFQSKFLINDACVIARKPFSHAGILKHEGQTTTIIPQKSRCLRCLFRSPPPTGSVPSCAEAGVLGSMAGTIGTIQATEAIKFLLQKGKLLTDRLLIYDSLDMEFRENKGPRRPDCAVCGNNPSITQPAEPDEHPSC